MNWFKVAFGLVREAVATQAGQKVMQDIGQAIRKDPAANDPQAVRIDVQTLMAEHRAQVDRNLEAMVQMLNAQNDRLTEAARRQRVWNIALAAGLAVAVAIAFLT